MSTQPRPHSPRGTLTTTPAAVNTARPAGLHLVPPAPARLLVRLSAVRCRFCGVLLRLVRVVPEAEGVCRHGYCGRAWCRSRRARRILAHGGIA
jgi:hypothetical protein